jgi:hypothetical protein
MDSPPFRISHDVAIPAQHFASNVANANLKGRDGMSKTTVWRKYACSEELRRCENVPNPAFAGASIEVRGFFKRFKHGRH